MLDFFADQIKRLSFEPDAKQALSLHLTQASDGQLEVISNITLLLSHYQQQQQQHYYDYYYYDY